ncbi:LysR family transcriptional regulator [Paenibacillus naphthalenovorans]|uniref:LysR family transcriptional regulator n=2 Tax=Paenibacillus TaxID=44249 RepID=A0A0U2W340_9BACL|nr:LysR family transcriptional regulator [Paenibacillus naphthalenovorans]ALS21925.1 LysR family transcriptional regulator [Paenibacillus naphthalenovorans]
MEIHQLEYFLAVEKYRNFSTASLEICVSQSTLSQQIKKLEDELGVKLFIRYSRSVRLTPAGEDFLVHAQRIVSEIQQSRETIQKYISFDKGSIKIGVFPNMACLGLNKIITSFFRTYPGIDFEIHTANTDDLLKGLREKKVNVAFINSPFPNHFEIDFFPLMNDHIVMLISSQHPLANESFVDLSDLSREKFLMIKTNAWFRNTLIHACNDAGFEPNVIFDTNDVEIIRSFAEDGVGVALMGYRVARCMSNPNNSIVPIRQMFERQSGLAIPKSTRPPLAASLFRDFTLKEMSRTLNSW